jgi:hypothetical protein
MYQNVIITTGDGIKSNYNQKKKMTIILLDQYQKFVFFLSATLGQGQIGI